MICFLWAVAIHFSVTFAALTGSGNSTRGWNCCKPSCSWQGKANVTSPVATCNKDNTPLTDISATSACGNGTAYGCADRAPWQVDNATAYGYAAVVITGKVEADWCCACFELTFTSGPARGRKMTVQSVDSMRDTGVNQFSLAVRINLHCNVHGAVGSDIVHYRFQAEVLAQIPRPARDNMGCLPQAGVKITEESHQCLLATAILLHSSRDANGALTGSEAPTTQGKPGCLYRGCARI